MAAAARDLPLPSPPLPAGPQQQQALCAAAGEMGWGRGLGQGLGVGGAQGLGFAMQDSRPENLDPPTHTVRLGSPLLTRDEEGDRRPSSI